MQVTLAHIGGRAKELLKSLIKKKGPVILALSGPLGSGKTTFVQALALHLGIEERVVSPTFLLMRRYRAKHPRFKELIHIDAYRVEDQSELSILPLAELFEREGALICIEWPERLGVILPLLARHISFAVEGENAREISL